MSVRRRGRPQHFSFLFFCGAQETCTKWTRFIRWVDNEHTLVVHKGTDIAFFAVDNKHANQGSRCSSVCTL